MQIAIILSKPPGYSETFFTSKIKGLQDNGIDVILYCQQPSAHWKLCPVVLAPKVSSNAFVQFGWFLTIFFSIVPYFRTVLRYFKLERNENTPVGQVFKKIYLNAHLLKAKSDWLHFGFATQAIGSETVAKAIGAQMAVSFRGFDINVYPVKHPECYTMLWKYVDKVHSISQYLLDKAIGMGLPAKTPSAIITPAVHINTLPVAKNILNPERIKIVTIARLTWIKGLDIAIAAMALLKENGLQGTYHIIGEGAHKDAERYKFMAYELGLKDEVIFCGKLSHAQTLEALSTATIYVQPSLNEGFCNAVLEAQAMGRLTIASAAGGLPENIVHGETGWLFETGNSQALAASIEKILTLSSEEKIKVSENAKARVKNLFSIEDQKKKFVAFYAE